MQVEVISALSDNYIYVIKVDDQAIVVDIGEYKLLRTYLKENNIRQVHLLITHKHDDHVAGLQALFADYPQTQVYTSEQIFAAIRWQVPQEARHYLQDEQEFTVAGLNFTALATPGHTDYHLCFSTGNLLFTGDLLFSAGCGKVMPDGSYEQLYSSIVKVKEFIGQGDFWLFPGHEYTLSNIAFARSLEQAQLEAPLAKLEEQTRQAFAQNRGNSPVLYSQEKLYNPFLQAKDLNQFTKLRQAKDQFGSSYAQAKKRQAAVKILQQVND